MPKLPPFLTLCLSLWLAASPLAAQDALGLAAPDTLAETGILRHILPRFSLKTGVRVRSDPAGPMQLAPAPPGTPVFRGQGTVWHLRTGDDPRQARFRDWLTSDVGKRTVEEFSPANGAPPFSASFEAAAAETAPAFEGDAARGADLARIHCRRCHVVSAAGAGGGIGSTPSFGVLRSLSDWPRRFEAFYVLKPHGAFTQIAGVTEPFDPERPPPIVPLLMTIEDVGAILAFVAVLPAADLGAPLKTQ